MEKNGGRILRFFQRICRFNFGNFEEDEFKKFLKLGLIFSLIIGVYWTLRPLKDSIFIQLVGKYYLPYAKTVSVLALLPLVMFYTKLLEKTSREKMMYILPAFYGVMIFLFGITLLIPQLPKMVLGFVFYLFVESFGSLVVALFWAFSADTTEPISAKRGFPLVYAFGQLGGVILPYNVGGLPHRFGHATDVFTFMCLTVLTLSIIPLFRFFLRTTSPDLLKSFGAEKKEEEKTKESGFLEGLKLLIKNKYLLGIFAANFVYEVVITIFDFNFKVAAGTAYSGVALSHYLCLYGSSVNIVSLLCLLLGISNVTRFLGVGAALIAMPVIVACALAGFLSLHSLTFLFTLMVGSKAINYALNGPALKQLYIPTTPDVKFKAQAWIETFGSRTSKQAGSLFNMLLVPLGRSYYLILSGVLCFPLLAFWLYIAIYLGQSFKKAVQKNTVIC